MTSLFHIVFPNGFLQRMISINSSCSDSFVSPFISLSEIEGQRKEINKGISRANKLSHASPYVPGISTDATS